MSDRNGKYVGQQCWQAVSQVRIRFGTCVAIKFEGDWLMAQVEWVNGTTWEKVANLNFDLRETFLNFRK